MHTVTVHGPYLIQLVAKSFLLVDYRMVDDYRFNLFLSRLNQLPPKVALEWAALVHRKEPLFDLETYKAQHSILCPRINSLSQVTTDESLQGLQSKLPRSATALPLLVLSFDSRLDACIRKECPSARMAFITLHGELHLMDKAAQTATVTGSQNAATAPSRQAPVNPASSGVQNKRTPSGTMSGGTAYAKPFAYDNMEGKTLYRDNSGGSPLTLGTKIGHGGEGYVYGIKGLSADAAKIFITDTESQRMRMREHEEKAKAWVALAVPHELHICSPTALLYDAGGVFRGFVMEKAPPVSVPLSSFFGATQMKDAKFISDWKYAQKLRLARTILETFAYLRNNHIVVGDIKGENIKVFAEDKTYFFDADSYAIKNYSCPVSTGDYMPPELLEQANVSAFLNEHTDDYAIAILLFRLLTTGLQTYLEVEDKKRGMFRFRNKADVKQKQWDQWEVLSPPLKNAFLQTFSFWGSSWAPAKRLTPKDWLAIL